MEIRRRFSLVILLLAGIISPFALADTIANTPDRASMWEDVAPVSLSSSGELAKNHADMSAYSHARFVNLDLQKMSDKLYLPLVARKGVSSQNHSLSVELPLPDGRFITVKIIEESVLPANLSNKFSRIKTFKISPDNFLVTGRLDITPNGFHALFQTRQGETIFIDPVTIKDKLYVSYRKSDQHHKNESKSSCSAKIQGDFFAKEHKIIASKAAGRTETSLLNYRIAIAATGEYTAKHGGTVEGALSAIATTLNRVNQVFEQDLGIHLSLVENNDQLIYVDASSDPYYEDDEEKLLRQSQRNIDAVIGSDNYDIGHLFTTSGGGLAAIGSACYTSRKAMGFSGVSNSYNDSFDLDFVAHEIGHQFGATHTFNGAQGLCSGDTRTARTAFEPGSGSSIMSYAGYCGQDNLQNNTDAMFHIGSIQQIRSYVMEGKGKRCGTYINIENTPPQVEAGDDYVIPAQTPFELEGKANDFDGDQLVYTWQQVDAGERSVESFDAGDNALFRVHLPTNSNKRSFPPISDIIAHSAERGENLPTQQRNMAFSLVVQDSYNAAQSDNITVQVERTGSRFALNLPRSQYTLGGTHEIFWNAASTDKPPINCENVDISLSTDGGFNFHQTLGQNLPNTGQALVIIPAETTTSSRGRFKIKCSNNIFFALSYRNFKLNDTPHSERLILIDEDQIESGLQDKKISQNEVLATLSESSPTESGGVFDWFLVFFFMILLVRNKELFIINRSI